jgi:hypothetical protein
MLLADQKPPAANPYASQSTSEDVTGASLRMARLYYDRYSWILDWSNVHGKTALHMASLKGNEELVRVRGYSCGAILKLLMSMSDALRPGR